MYAMLKCTLFGCLYQGFYLCVHAVSLCAEYLFRALINLIFLCSCLRLCHEAGLLLQYPLPVYFDHLPGC